MESNSTSLQCYNGTQALLDVWTAAAGSHSHEHADSDGHDHGNMNLRGAVLHVIGDLVQSIGVAFAGILIWVNQVRLYPFRV